MDCYSHWELETLPSGGWGYQHFPVTMRYARNLGVNVFAATRQVPHLVGRLSLLQEPGHAAVQGVPAVLAMNAKCMIGDQLPPRGRIEPYVYDLVGKVYAEVETKEPWCVGAKALSEIAVFTPEEFGAASARRTARRDQGSDPHLGRGSAPV